MVRSPRQHPRARSKSRAPRRCGRAPADCAPSSSLALPRRSQVRSQVRSLREASSDGTPPAGPLPSAAVSVVKDRCLTRRWTRSAFPGCVHALDVACSAWRLRRRWVQRECSSCPYPPPRVARWRVRRGRRGELVATDESETVGLVGVAEQQQLAVGCELGVVVGAAADADGGEVGDVVGAAPRARPQVMDLQAGAAVAAG